MSRPRIALHIGRNKAGSTTIQHALAASGDALAAGGIGYGLFGHLADSDPALPGWATFDALAAHAARHQDRVWLVSNEFMSAWPDAFTAAAGAALAGCDVRVIAYVRRYDDWLRSAYAEDVGSGANALAIDDYARAMAPRVSALPNLEGWARAFGWERLRVRGLSRGALAGGDLLVDFAVALGLATPLVRVTSSNVRPHWTTLEMLRALAAIGLSTSDAIRPLAAAMAVVAAGVPDRPYLDIAQVAALRKAYAADATILRGHGQVVPDESDTITAPERDAMPGFALIPDDVRARFFVAVAAPEFATRHPAAAAAAVRLRASA